VGGVAFLAIFVPDYGHFRTGAVIGILTTTLTSFYLFVASLSIGQVGSLYSNHKRENVIQSLIFMIGVHEESVHTRCHDCL